jgi:hypothetical protein
MKRRAFLLVALLLAGLGLLHFSRPRTLDQYHSPSTSQPPRPDRARVTSPVADVLSHNQTTSSSVKSAKPAAKRDAGLEFHNRVQAIVERDFFSATGSRARQQEGYINRINSEAFLQERELKAKGTVIGRDGRRIDFDAHLRFEGKGIDLIFSSIQEPNGFYSGTWTGALYESGGRYYSVVSYERLEEKAGVTALAIELPVLGGLNGQAEALFKDREEWVRGEVVWEPVEVPGFTTAFAKFNEQVSAK